MYYQSDYILRIIEDMARFLDKLVHHHEAGQIESIVDENGVIDELTFFEYRLNKLFYAGKYNEAEALLLNSLQNKDGARYLTVAHHFYQQLAQVDAKKREADGYTAEQLADGIELLKKRFEFEDTMTD